MSLFRQKVSPSIFSCLTRRKLVHFNVHYSFSSAFLFIPKLPPPLQMPKNNLSIKQGNLAMKMFRDACVLRQKHALLLVLVGSLKESMTLLFWIMGAFCLIRWNICMLCAPSQHKRVLLIGLSWKIFSAPENSEKDEFASEWVTLVSRESIKRIQESSACPKKIQEAFLR